MSDCSGYGIFADISLCVAGPVGNGSKTTLLVYLANASGRFMFSNSPREVPIFDWDGGRVEIDLLGNGYLSEGFTHADCDLDSATLTITPDDGGDNYGEIELKFEFSDCVATTSSFNPRIFENCGGSGPHTITETMVFTLDPTGCPVVLP